MNFYVRTWICLRTYVNLFTYVREFVYVRTWIFLRTYVNLYVYTWTFLRIYVKFFTYIRENFYVYTWNFLRTYVNIFTYIREHFYVYIYMWKLKHINTCVGICGLSICIMDRNERDELVRLYFHLGFSHREILYYLISKHDILLSHRHLKRILKRTKTQKGHRKIKKYIFILRTTDHRQNIRKTYSSIEQHKLYVRFYEANLGKLARWRKCLQQLRRQFRQ